MPAPDEIYEHSQTFCLEIEMLLLSSHPLVQGESFSLSKLTTLRCEEVRLFSGANEKLHERLFIEKKQLPRMKTIESTFQLDNNP